MMRILDILTSPWAILPEKLEEMCAIYRAHLRGEKPNFAAIEAAIGKKLDNQPRGYTIVDGVAVLPLEGVIAKRMNLLTRVSGGVSTQLFQRDLMAAADDPEARGILLLVDSPGGTVDGTQAAMQAVRQAREKKRVMALIDGLGASAAYWIASAAERIFLADDTTQAGSIGVVATHEDWSRYEEKIGIRTTEITAGRYKRIASQYAPLSPEGRATIQEQVDQIYTIFVNDVAANRGRDVETVLRDMADGRVFIGQRAVAAGLADGIQGLDGVIAWFAGPTASATSPKGENTMEKVVVCGVECLTQEEVDTAVANAIATAIADARAAAGGEAEARLAEARAEGAAAERERILAIEANALPGHEDLVREMILDGRTTGPEAAERILAAEKSRQGRIAQDLAGDAPRPAPADEAASAEPEPHIDPKTIAQQAQQYVNEQAGLGRRVSYAEAVRHVMERRV